MPRAWKAPLAADASVIGPGLTQVLADGSSTYLCGLGRIGEQQAAGWMYHLSDALGSVRQLADASVNVTLARSYRPFGDPLMTTGAGTSIYGFTGEQRDGTGLVYLRARYYGSAFGRFLSRDPWEGDPNQPMSYNAWLYVYGNPVSRADPRGLYSEDVHFRRTYVIAQQEVTLRCPTCFQDLTGIRFASLLANANNRVDHDPDLRPVPGGAPDLHFTSDADAWSDLGRAVREMDPWLVGAALHEIQDYWSHYYEGYRYPGTLGHSLDTAQRYRAQVLLFPHTEKILLTHLWITGNIAWPTKEALIDDIVAPSSALAGLSTLEVFDAWLRVQAGPPDTRRAAAWKEMYGYLTDDYYWFTARDQEMIHDTREAIRDYLDELNATDICRFLQSPETEPLAVRRFLRGEE